MPGKIEGEKRGRQEIRMVGYSFTNSMDLSLGSLWELMMDKRSLAYCSSWGLKETDMTQQG